MVGLVGKLAGLVLEVSKLLLALSNFVLKLLELVPLVLLDIPVFTGSLALAKGVWGSSVLGTTCLIRVKSNKALRTADCAETSQSHHFVGFNLCVGESLFYTVQHYT